ncbi:hypothetical protein BABINDRAFT_38662 [Babjeviella inositovora NRRL Y-12698]|uniref:DASH complex subunit DAD1 n=1 Tax=Babjeviella inositovora NRRL Y-12698 TaxID=984486 RepID=A0A1E3QLY5_9ASCO|nr:uncharacterized protein BABINDRAFT_38662 [Babjeviella inositovora NRRL Y-12698]ODQ78703.1 hypothetical protein BABINDRAFT_38662 [Babjeviella inositovora NRRL Y-12698]
MTTQPESPSLTYFEKQRDLLIQEISNSMESVLNNVNALNRSLEGGVAVGKEFDSVSQLWGTFYDGMAQAENLKRKHETPPPLSAESAEEEPESRN